MRFSSRDYPRDNTLAHYEKFTISKMITRSDPLMTAVDIKYKNAFGCPSALFAHYAFSVSGCNTLHHCLDSHLPMRRPGETPAASMATAMSCV
jgi:hypothetical protein